MKKVHRQSQEYSPAPVEAKSSPTSTFGSSLKVHLSEDHSQNHIFEYHKKHGNSETYRKFAEGEDEYEKYAKKKIQV
jgi:arylamine N-acetyltransferase